MKLKLSHIALACSEIRDVARKLEKLSLKVESTHVVPTEKVTAAMIPVEVSNHFRIELLEPTATDSPIAKFLEKKPQGGIHHLCSSLLIFRSIPLEKHWELTTIICAASSARTPANSPSNTSTGS